MRQDGNSYFYLLTVKELAEMTQFTPKKVRELIREGTLPGVRMGREYRISRKTLIDWAKPKEERGTQ